MKIIGIIPARMASTRFPGKPMMNIKGMPMIGHIYYRCLMCNNLDDVYVATCDNEIYNYIVELKGKAVMTANTHERASDRAAEALEKIERETGEVCDIVAMIQGDEPLLEPEAIDNLVGALRDEQEEIPITNLIEEIPSIDDQLSSSIVKIVMDNNDFALYFSREAIPSQKMTTTLVKRFKQLGIIAFRRQMLLDFNKLPPTPLEKIESVDMNRVLEHGYKIKLVKTTTNTVPVDTPEDLARVESLMAKDILYPKYAS